MRENPAKVKKYLKAWKFGTEEACTRSTPISDGFRFSGQNSLLIDMRALEDDSADKKAAESASATPLEVVSTKGAARRARADASPVLHSIPTRRKRSAAARARRRWKKSRKAWLTQKLRGEQSPRERLLLRVLVAVSILTLAYLAATV